MSRLYTEQRQNGHVLQKLVAKVENLQPLAILATVWGTTDIVCIHVHNCLHYIGIAIP